jgi:hypothetical protein
MDTPTLEIDEYARQLFAVHGDKAIVEASERARSADRRGDGEEAKIWRSVADKIRSMRGPHAT